MTPAERLQFNGGLAALGTAFGKEVDTVLQQIYATELDDVPWPTLKLAMRAALKTCTFFPKIAELRQFADAVEQRPDPDYTLTALPATVDGQYQPDLQDEPRYHCPDCHDRGIIIDLVCEPGNRCTVQGCKRFRDHASSVLGIPDWEYPTHTYSKPCPCRSTNPVIQRQCEEWNRTHRPAAGKYHTDRRRRFRDDAPEGEQA